MSFWDFVNSVSCVVVVTYTKPGFQFLTNAKFLEGQFHLFLNLKDIK